MVKFSRKCPKIAFWLTTIILLGEHYSSLANGQAVRRPSGNRNKLPDKPAILKDAFHEDNAFVVRIRTTYNQTTSITCNAVVMEEQLVLSDVTCIKYQGMANIDARYVHVIAGEPASEQVFEVDQIYINKADPKDPGTELALLRLTRPLKVDTQCRQLIRPERNHSIEFETGVRVIGYTQNYELKENRSKIARRSQSNKYVCTTAAEVNETPGSQLLKGAPLLSMVDCRQYQLVGILTKLETVQENTPASKKHQDCYVMVSSQMRWYEQVKSLSILAAKNDGASTQPSVVLVTVDDPVIESKEEDKP